jgi:hypothetical protein
VSYGFIFRQLIDCIRSSYAASDIIILWQSIFFIAPTAAECCTKPTTAIGGATTAK